MKAAVLDSPGPILTRPLRIMDAPMPTVKPGEVLLRVSACGVCRTDLHVVEGELPPRKSPVVPGHQVVGRIASSGAGVENFKVGDRAGLAWLNETCGVCRFCRGSR